MNVEMLIEALGLPPAAKDHIVVPGQALTIEFLDAARVLVSYRNPPIIAVGIDHGSSKPAA